MISYPYESLSPDDITISVKGVEVGHIAPVVLQALIDSDLFRTPYDSEPQRKLREICAQNAPACFCGEPAAHGVFCERHFAEGMKNPGFMVCWHGEDWTRALEAAREAVSHVG